MLKKMINWLFLIAGIACILYYIGCGLSIRFGQSMLWAWLVLGAALIIRFIIVRISIARGAPLPYPSWFLRLFRGGCILAVALFLFVEAFIIHGAFTKMPAGVDYLIVLGAKTESITINRRIAAAAEYLHENPGTIAIASGGQGSDEETSEGAYIAAGLERLGIPRERILIEDKSTSTSENIRFSAALIPAGEATVGLVTNDYHVFRARRLAMKVFRGEVYALPARSNKLTLPHYLMREFFTTTVDTLRGNMVLR